MKLSYRNKNKLLSSVIFRGKVLFISSTLHSTIPHIQMGFKRYVEHKIQNDKKRKEEEDENLEEEKSS